MESFLAVRECPHLYRFAIAECEDIREAYIPPDVAIMGTNTGMDENDDSSPTG